MSTSGSNLVKVVYHCDISKLNVVLDWLVEDDPPPEAIDCPYHTGTEAHAIPCVNILGTSKEGGSKIGGPERMVG